MPPKVLPNRKHTAEYIWSNAESLGSEIRSGVPQFKLLRSKKFVITRDRD